MVEKERRGGRLELVFKRVIVRYGNFPHIPDGKGEKKAQGRVATRSGKRTVRSIVEMYR
jgi:hypothetical protein